MFTSRRDHYRFDPLGPVVHPLGAPSRGRGGAESRPYLPPNEAR